MPLDLRTAYPNDVVVPEEVVLSSLTLAQLGAVVCFLYARNRAAEGENAQIHQDLEAKVKTRFESNELTEVAKQLIDKGLLAIDTSTAGEIHIKLDLSSV